MASLSNIGAVGWWAPSGGRLAAGDVLLSAFAPVNFRLAQNFANRSLLTPPANSATAFQAYYDQRLNAFGSAHPGGAFFLFCDAGVRFIWEDADPSIMNALSTRDGNPHSGVERIIHESPF